MKVKWEKREGRKKDHGKRGLGKTKRRCEGEMEIKRKGGKGRERRKE